jgi:hypothetical protein
LAEIVALPVKTAVLGGFFRRECLVSGAETLYSAFRGGKTHAANGKLAMFSTFYMARRSRRPLSAVPESKAARTVFVAGTR